MDCEQHTEWVMSNQDPEPGRDERDPTIGVRRLRTDLASHVRRAGDGHEVVVTVNGRPTARLGPVVMSAPVRGDGGPRAMRWPDLEALAATGLLRRPLDAGHRRTRPPALIPRFPVDVDPSRAITEALGR